MINALAVSNNWQLFSVFSVKLIECKLNTILRQAQSKSCQNLHGEGEKITFQLRSSLCLITQSGPIFWSKHKTSALKAPTIPFLPPDPRRVGEPTEATSCLHQMHWHNKMLWFATELLFKSNNEWKISASKWSTMYEMDVSALLIYCDVLREFGN